MRYIILYPKLTNTKFTCNRTIREHKLVYTISCACTETKTLILHTRGGNLVNLVWSANW